MRDTPERRYRHSFGPRLEHDLKPPRFDYGEAIGALALWAVVLAVAIILICIAFAVKAQAGEFRSGERADISLCRGWIETTCSCSHRACWEARPDEFEDLHDGRWRETSSGQVKLQTGWSRDGVFIACAWRSGEPGSGVQYHVGKGQALSCLYPPVKGF